MQDKKVSINGLFLKSARPISLAVCILTYFMGIGISVYLGHPINWNTCFLGLGCILLILLAGYYLFVFFDWLQPGFKYKDQIEPSSILTIRPLFYQVPVILLSAALVVLVVLYLQIKFFILIWFILGIAIGLAVLYAVPPFRLVYSGFGELIEAVLVCNLPPTLAFVLQVGSIHRLVTIFSLPVTLLFMAMLLALSLPDYAQDIKYARKNLMVRMGWQTGMTMLNLLILSAYIIILLTSFLGLPVTMIVPPLCTLPLACFQVWQIYRISTGSKPHWQWIKLSAYALPILLAYLFTAAAWMG